MFVHQSDEEVKEDRPTKKLSTFERANMVVEENVVCVKLANSMDSNDLVLSANVASPCPGVPRGIPTLSSSSVPVTGPIPCLASSSVPVTAPELSSFQSSCRQKNRAEARLNSLYLGEETTAAKARCDSYSVRCCMFQLCSAETSPHSHMLAPEGVYTRTIRVDSCNVHACAPSQQDPTDSILKACNVSMCSPSSPMNTMADRPSSSNDTATTDICSLSMCASALRISICPTSCTSTSPCTARCITVDVCSPERLYSISPPNDAASARHGEWKHLSLNCCNVVLCSRPPKKD
jgi:hypothetical protein